MFEKLKQIERKSEDARLAGVCAAIAEYFNTKALTVRIIYIIFSILTAFLPGFFLYMFLMLLIPKAVE